MPDTAAPSPQLFFETINAFHKTGALKAAIDLELFTALAEDPATPGELAARCQCPERGIRILADYLTIQGFLTKEDGRYALTTDSAVFLVRTSPAYMGGSVNFFLSPAVSEAFRDLTPIIRRGRLDPADLGTTAPDHDVWLEFARAMGPMMVPAARGAAELVALDADCDTRILDVSASHGVYGITFAKKFPRAHLVALDWEAVLSLTKANVQAAGLADRFSTISGDAFTVDLGTDYDVILVPNFLHHFNDADCTRFLRRVHAALRPGGHVIIIEFVPNEDRITPPPAASFSFVMLGTTPEGDAYTFAELRAMLLDSGFHDATRHPLEPTAASAVMARK